MTLAVTAKRLLPPGYQRALLFIARRRCLQPIRNRGAYHKSHDIDYTSIHECEFPLPPSWYYQVQFQRLQRVTDNTSVTAELPTFIQVGFLHLVPQTYVTAVSGEYATCLVLDRIRRYNLSGHLMYCSHDFYYSKMSLKKPFSRPPNASSLAFSIVFGNRL